MGARHHALATPPPGPPAPALAILEGSPTFGRIAELAAAAGASLVVLPPGGAGFLESPVEPRLLARVDASSGNRCAGLDGPVGAGCPADPARLGRLEASVEGAVRDAGGVLLEGLDALAALPPFAAGACPACVAALATELHGTYGPPERFTPPTFPDAWREPATDPLDRPFAREALLGLHRRQAALARRLLGAARGAGASTVAVRASGTTPLLPLLARHDGPVLLAGGGRLALELARDGGRRLVHLELPPHGRVGELLREAYAAAAVDAESTPRAGWPGPALAAVAALRAFRAALPPSSAPLVDVAALYAPSCDVLVGGAHRTATAAVVEAVAAAGFLAGAAAAVRELPEGAVLLVAGAAALDEEEHAALLGRIEAGAIALVIGPYGAADRDGLPVSVDLPAAPGEHAVGRGLLVRLPGGEPGALLPAVRQRLADRRRLVRIAGRGRLLASASRLEQGARLRLANLDLEGDAFRPPQGLVLTLGGALAATEAAQLLAPGRDPEPVPVNASARATSLVLPRLPPFATLELAF